MAHATDIHVGQTIRDKRRALLMTQGDLAERIGTTFQQLQKYERADNRVSASRLVMIASALGCAPADLLPRSSPSIESAMAAVLHKPGGASLVAKLAHLSGRDIAVLAATADTMLAAG